MRERSCTEHDIKQKHEAEIGGLAGDLVIPRELELHHASA